MIGGRKWVNDQTISNVVSKKSKYMKHIKCGTHQYKKANGYATQVTCPDTLDRVAGLWSHGGLA